jgi:xylose isomerase
MNFSGRINSFIFKGNYDVLKTIDQYREIDGVTHLEFNYPEHISPYSIEGTSGN